MEHREADVVIVGAGLAGLTAARRVAQAGLTPIVLEARDRVGGRTVNEPIGDGVIVEMGGQFVAARDTRLRPLLAELGLEIFPVYDQGRHLLDVGRGIKRYKGALPKVAPRTLLELGRARMRIDRSARKVPSDAPWTSKHAAEWDRTSIGDWLDKHVSTREGRTLLDAAFTSIWADDPHDVNILGALSRVHEAGGFDNLTGTKGGVLQDRVVGGATRAADLMAAELDVLLDTPVESINGTGSRVEVEARDVRVSARRAIVAVPPVLARRIRFDSGLPEARRKALEHLPPGQVIKVAAVYDTPFWREQGLSGRALTSEGPVSIMFDNSPPDGSVGVLIGFIPGPRVADVMQLNAGERRRVVLESFARLFGPVKPVQYLEKNWVADPWSRGCYYGLPAPGIVTECFPTWADPVGAIHWAGTETTFRSLGGMNGAVTSGERAAGEVLAALAVAVEPATV
jgi:monoamine oxidase